MKLREQKERKENRENQDESRVSWRSCTALPVSDEPRLEINDRQNPMS